MFEYFIHPSLQNPAHPNFRKAFWASRLMVVLFIFIFLYSIYFIWDQPHNVVKQCSNIGGIVFLLFVLLQLKYTDKLNLILTQTAIIGLLPTFISIYHTGGIYSADIIWLSLNLVCAYLIVSITTGLIMLGVILVYISYLYYQDHFGYQVDFKNFVLANTSNHHILTYVFIFILLSSILIVFVKTLQKTNKELELLKANQILLLEKKLKEKTEEISSLRADLAKDFHDEMGNKLASISLLSQSVLYKIKAEPEINSMLETIDLRSKELFDGTKDFIWSIDIKSDYPYELFLYLREFGEVFFHNLEIDFYAETNFLLNDTFRIANNSGRQLIYIIKEIFTNAAKHSFCTKVSFSVMYEDDFLIISLFDNGKGFDLEHHNLRRGLNNI
ncbi:MAG: hypothetical protein U0V72_15165 [Cytophagales bacterium]